MRFLPKACMPMRGLECRDCGDYSALRASPFTELGAALKGVLRRFAPSWGMGPAERSFDHPQSMVTVEGPVSLESR
jgi:hypothetical protein